MDIGEKSTNVTLKIVIQSSRPNEAMQFAFLIKHFTSVVLQQQSFSEHWSINRTE